MSETFEWAIKNGDLDKVKEDLKKGADANASVGSGRSPLCVAADYGQTHVLLHLLQAGADVNRADKYGVTPLLAAIFEGHTACVRSLLEAGANKDGRSPDGATYLEAAEKEDIKCLLR